MFLHFLVTFFQFITNRQKIYRHYLDFVITLEKSSGFETKLKDRYFGRLVEFFIYALIL